MAINKKLIHFKTLEKFNTELANGNILDTSIVFIKDAQKIWTHGTLYDCDAAALREEIIKNEEVVAAALNDLQENKASKTYVDEAVANAGSDDIYIFEPIDGTDNEDGTISGTITKEQAEAIKKATFIQYGIILSRYATSDSTYGYYFYMVDPNTYLFISCAIVFDVEELTYTITNASGNINTENVTEETVSNWGFTKNTGTVTGVKINGTTKNPSSGVVDLGTVITEHQALKTINGESIVGSGNITIEGGSSGVEWETAPGFDERGYWCVMFDAIRGTIMSPNKIYVVPNLTVGALDLSNLEHVNDYGDEYRIIFKTHDTYPPGNINLSKDYNIVYENGIEPEFNKKDTWYDVRLIRTVHNGEQQICVIATEFSNQPSSGGSSGGSSDANVQAVDTGDVLDDVNVDYATKAYVDGLVGDINSVLESIINS